MVVQKHSRREHQVRMILAGWILALGSSYEVSAQDEVRNFRKPILVVETEGHHARVRSLLWHDGSTLLTAGEDKVVKVWDFRDGPRLIRSLRPPIWRGPAGTIYAIAATRPDSQGQSYLAVGGYGVENRRGDITIFRFPGADPAPGKDVRVPTGDVVARLLPPDGRPSSVGHTNSVFCLAFDPKGSTLASGSLDTTVILWEVPSFRPRAVLRGHRGGVRSLGFSADGQRLATAGADGSLRLWDVATAAQIDVVEGNLERPVAINTLAVSPDGRAIVVGRENGDLYQFDARTPSRVAPLKLPSLPTQGPVENLTFSPDGTRLAVCLKTDQEDILDPMRLTSDVEIRAFPGGNVLRRYRVAGQTLGLSFDPAGSRLAYGGGHSQSIFIQDLANLDRAPLELRGQGSTPFDLGFTADSQALGFTRNPPAAAAAAVYEGFDLGRRRTRRVSRDELRRAIRSLNGWSLSGSLREYRLEAVHQDGRRWRFDLDRDTERNWWSSTMIPAGPGHPRATVAIGCESGVVVYDLETGRRTRVFAGHTAPVVALAPSPDGRWLASGSLDQTIQVYPLEGCDVRPGLGARLRQRSDRTWELTAVEKGGFAAAMGLLAGDVITWAGIARGRNVETYDTPETLAQFARRVDSRLPHLDVIAIRARRTVPQPPPLGLLTLPLPLTGTTKRNNPALTLMLGADGEWVVWTPQGYYDTSIEGDARFLGWHLNADYRSTRPTDFFPIETFAETMLQPRVLERLWQRGNLQEALAAATLPAGIRSPEEEVVDRQPPEIRFQEVAGGVKLPAAGALWVVSTPNPRVGVKITAAGATRIAGRRVIADEQLLDLPPIPRLATTHVEEIGLSLAPGRRVRLLVEATNETGKRRRDFLDLLYLPADPTPPPVAQPRIQIVSLGSEQARDPGKLPPIPFAERDAAELAEFLSQHLVSADGVRPAGNATDNRVVLTGEHATAQKFDEAIEQLDQLLRAGDLKSGDLVALVIASHVLEFEHTTIITTRDTDPDAQPLPEPAVSTRDISGLLGRLTDYGCRVVLFLDGVHELPAEGMQNSIKRWVRDLQKNRRVITFVASKEGPSEADQTAGHGLFALGVLRAFQGAAASDVGQDRGGLYSLELFRRSVRRAVLDLSGRRQEADAYIPLEVDPRTPFAIP